MISLDQVLLLEQKVESAVAKIAQLQAENDALRSRCSELTNALSSKSEQLSSFESDQNKIESGILKALDKLNSIENSVLKAGGQVASADGQQNVVHQQIVPQQAQNVTQPQVQQQVTQQQEQAVKQQTVEQEPQIQQTQEQIQPTQAEQNTQPSFFDLNQSSEQPEQTESTEQNEQQNMSEDGQFDIF